MSVRFPVALVNTLPFPVSDVAPTIIEGAGPSARAEPSVMTSQKNVFPVNLKNNAIGSNAYVDDYLKKHASDFMTPEAEMSALLKSKIQQQWGIAIDPDTTYLVTFKGSGRTEADVVEKLTLTQAALKNSQDVPIKNDENWFQKIGKFFSPLVFAYNKIEGTVEKSHEQQTIYQASGDSLPYSANTLIDIPVADFKQLVWDTDRTTLYENTLNTFWSKHTSSYLSMSRMSFLKAVKQQSLDGSLSPDASKLALRLMGAFAAKPWSELSVEDFAKPSSKDPGLEIGLLSINGMQSTDLLCVVDKETQLTLLYIPGNSSPLHTFDNPQQIPQWVAKQATDPVKLAALQTHFTLKDQANKVLFEGVRQSLEGLGEWSKAQQIEGFSFDKINDWKPERYVAIDSLSGDPFQQITARQKTRSFSDATVAIVTDGDYRKNKIIDIAEETAKVALFMTPLALVMPEVALALDAFYLAAGATEAGIGIDDAVKGKATGTDRIVFGALNALPPLVVHGAGSVSRALKPESEGAAQLESVSKERPSFFKPPQRINGQVGYPMSPASPPHFIAEIQVPMDGITVMKSSDCYVSIGGYMHQVIFDPEPGAWRGLNNEGKLTENFYWRDGQGKWCSGTQDVLIARAESRAASMDNRTVTLPVLPDLPTTTEQVPKVIHYVWAGNEMPEKLVNNIIDNSRKSPGYKSIVHVDANNQDVFLKIKAALDHKVGGLEVHDLKTDTSYRKLQASQAGELYQYFRSGQGQNLSASSDVMRYALMKEHGGIYLDTDDSLTRSVGEVSLRAAPHDILLNSNITYEPADFAGFNTSSMASLPGNPLFDKILQETYQRFKSNKAWLDANRPFLKSNPTAAELEAYKVYEKKIFEVTGPDVFNDVLRREQNGSMKWLDADAELDKHRVILPRSFGEKSRALRDYFTAMHGQFGVDIGREHSMRHSR